MRRALLLVPVLVGLAAWWAWPSSSTSVTLTMADVRGLVEGGAVRIAGVESGKVDSIALGADGYPRVRLSVDGDADLRAGATAALRLGSLSGERNRYVALDPGAGAPLPDGAHLGRSRTRVPVEIDDVLQSLDAPARADARATLRGLRAALTGDDGRPGGAAPGGSGAAGDDALADRGDAIRDVLADAPTTLGASADALRDVDHDGAALRGLVADGRALSAALERRRETVGASVARVRGLLGTAAGRAREIDATIGALPGALASAQDALGETRSTLEPLRTAVRAAAPGVAQLEGAAGEARATLAAARPALASGATLVRDAPAQLRAVEPLLRDASPVLRRAAPVLRRLGPMTDQARVRLPDFFSFFSNWADFTSGYDANGHAARVGIVLPPGGTNVADPDTQERGQLDAPYLRVPGALEQDPWRDFEDSFVAGDG